MNEEEIKEISKVDKQLLDKIEYILGSELSNEEYDKFYNYFNEIRKPNILIDIKDISEVIKQIETISKELDQYKNNWEELKKWLEEQHQFIIVIPAFTKEIIQEHKTMELCYEDILNKMKELEEDNNGY